MNKEELEEVFYIQREIKQLEISIEKLKTKANMIADVVQNGYKRRAIIQGVDVKIDYKLRNYYEQLKEFRIKLIDKQRQIESYIEEIPFSEIRQIFRLRYIEGMNWIQASHEMNRLYKNREYNDDSIRKKHDRFLKKF